MGTEPISGHFHLIADGQSVRLPYNATPEEIQAAVDEVCNRARKARGCSGVFDEVMAADKKLCRDPELEADTMRTVLEELVEVADHAPPIHLIAELSRVIERARAVLSRLHHDPDRAALPGP